MPSTTPVYALPFPESTDPTDVPGDIEALALEVEAELTRMDKLPTPIVITATRSFASSEVTGAKALRIRCVGGGGAGGGAPATGASQSSAGGGGQAGSYSESVIAITAITFPVTVTRGAAGSTALGANGGTGGQSSFGTLVTAPGGEGGYASTAGGTPLGFAANALGGHLGALGTGQIAARGNQGNHGLRFTATNALGGYGGGSVFGGGAWGGAGGAPGPAGAYGAGGAGAGIGASTGAVPGGAADVGVVIVEPIY